MKNFRVICCVIFVFGVCCVDALLEEYEIQDVCCTQGENSSVTFTSTTQCAGIALPDEVEPSQEELCRVSLTSCCDTQITLRSECTGGMVYAPDKKCNIPKTDIGKTCCEECSFGRWAGESQGRDSCGDPPGDDISPSTALRNNAYYKCCVEAADTPTTTEIIPETTTEKRVEKQKCKRTSCDHLCNDEDGKITCTCQPGFRLQADKKSCKDINECAESLDDLCTKENTVCHNVPGSYRCVPLKKREVGINCPAGFKRNVLNQVCDDVNECQLPRPPCPKYLCENTIGGYKCGGKPGTPITESPTGGALTPAPPITNDTNDICPQGFRAGPNDECVDIDECAEGVDDCQHLSQHCINTHGHFFCQDHVSKRCSPGFKINTATGKCMDIDECEESLEVCKATEVCVNLAGAYDCKSKISTLPKIASKNCQEGTRLRPGGSICEDIDECREGTHLCDQFQNCINTYGGHECRCKNGFELDSSTGSCVDVDECALKLDNCGTRGTCLNVLGSYTCTRRPQVTTTSTRAPPVSNVEYEYFYSDEEEIAASESTSSTSTTTAKPANTTRPPYRPRPRPTTPRPSLYTPRTTTSRPSSTTGRIPYTNSHPKPTYTLPENIPRTNPVATTPPTPVTNPTPSYNRFTPRIPLPPELGPRPDSTTPRTINPKPESNTVPTTARNPPPRVPNNYPLTPKPASNARPVFPTVPKPNPNSINTEDGGPEEPDDINKHCINGYEKNEFGDCVDTDECESGLNSCSSLEVCSNRQGGYVCLCIAGFRRGSLGWCEAIPPPRTTSTTTTTTSTTTEKIEEEVPPLPPTPPVRYNPSRSHSRPSYTNCELGYEYDSLRGECVDIDECATNRAHCKPEEECVNTDGGYRCNCGATCRQDGYRPTYVIPAPRPPPVTDPGVITVGAQYGHRGSRYIRPNYSHQLHSGAVVTSCPWGYQLTAGKTQCLDVDECARNTSECGPQQTCENFFGGYSCQCPKGHKLVGQIECEDIDECTYGNPCSPNSRCINTVGSYRCECSAGFRNAPANERVCMDVDECSETPEVCEQGCSNAWGSYRCYCNRGYRLNSDNRSCADVDECAEWAASRSRGRLCGGECRNVPGSYTCVCPKGYNLAADTRNCIDIDECENGEATCASGSAGEVCQNTRGGYHCHQIQCPRGYRLEAKHRCSRIQRSCLYSDWNCLQQPSTYSYNFITFVANVYLPKGSVDLFTMHGPSWSDSTVTFEMRLVSVQAPSDVKPADFTCFDMRPTNNVCVISLLCSLEGPQVIELELTMSLYQRSQFSGSAVARLIIIVSQYEF